MSQRLYRLSGAGRCARWPTALCFCCAVALAGCKTSAPDDSPRAVGVASLPPPPSTPPAPAHGAVAAQTPARTLQALGEDRFAVGPFSMTVPAAWIERPTTSNMRVAEFSVGGGTDGAAEVIVYYFGQRGAGSAQDNVDRWLGQFKQPGGGSSREVATIESARFAQGDATLVRVSGTYSQASSPGAGDAVDRAGQSLFAAVVDSPKGPYYFRLIGDEGAVEAQTAAFRAALGSLRRR